MALGASGMIRIIAPTPKGLVRSGQSRLNPYRKKRLANKPQAILPVPEVC
jgi:hypothetical protein